jgi:hypothetical protein
MLKRLFDLSTLPTHMVSTDCLKCLPIHCRYARRVVEYLGNRIAPNYPALDLNHDQATLGIKPEKINPSSFCVDLPTDDRETSHKQVGMGLDPIFQLLFEINPAASEP